MPRKLFGRLVRRQCCVHDNIDSSFVVRDDDDDEDDDYVVTLDRVVCAVLLCTCYMKNALCVRGPPLKFCKIDNLIIIINK